MTRNTRKAMTSYPCAKVLILKDAGQICDLPVRGVPQFARGRRPPQVADRANREVCSISPFTMRTADRRPTDWGLLSRRTSRLFLLFVGLSLGSLQRSLAAANVVLWDTTSRFTDSVEVADRTHWKPVPSDLFALEVDPPKAASDPGYYGREYSFTGDAVVENRSLSAMFWSSKGRVVLYSRTQTTASGEAPSISASLGAKILEFAPLQTWSQPSTISRCDILRNAGDEVALKVFFSAKGSPEMSVVFSFGKTEIVAITPDEKMKGIRLVSSMEHGVVPSFIGDDLIFSPRNYPSNDTLSLPSENLFLGLLKGEESVLVMTWPKGKQQVKLGLRSGQDGRRVIEFMDFENDGQSLYLAALQSPGIWHREELKPSFLEKDVAIQWKRPFPAKWTTQLAEAGVKTTFTFRESKGQIWRGVPGSYSYPTWFDGDAAFYHLSKKVPPQGESLIYFREGDQTPYAISTPVDILKATLGRQMSDELLDLAGRKLRTHHRTGGSGVHRGCTCGYTEAIQAVFEKGEEVAKRDYISAALDDMVFFVRSHLERIDEYRHFAEDIIKFLRARAGTELELKPYADSLEQIAQQIPQKYSVQLENMKSLGYADELTRRTLALTQKKDPKNLAAFMDLLKEWRSMGGAQDSIVAECHSIARQLFQEAGYACANLPKAVELAQEVRTRTRQCLRNPDGYEIWPNY